MPLNLPLRAKLRIEMQKSAKDEAIELIRNLPADCSFEDIQYHLYVIEKVHLSQQSVLEGKVINMESVEKKFDQWIIK